MAADTQAQLKRLMAGENLAEGEAADLLRALADEELPGALAGAVLTALALKGETADEVRGFATAMRELARAVELPDGLAAADSVGTGGDGSHSLNLSTGTGLLAAACGVPVIKHGNRSVSSKSGSADVLAALGVPQPDTPAAALACLEQCGFAFLFAPFYHPAMKAIAPVRGAMGVRTVFNILGPLVNPATPPYHLVGAFDLATARLMADALAGMDIERAFVVHGAPGWDEATPVGPFHFFDVRGGRVSEALRDPADYGVARCAAAELAGGDAAFNASALEAVLSGNAAGAHLEALALGAGLVLELTGAAPDLAAGVARARDAAADGTGAELLARLRAVARA